MAWNQNLTHLRDWFADRYYDVDESRRVLMEAGLKPRLIHFSSQPVTNWHIILQHAQHQQAVDKLIDVAIGEYPAHKTYLLAAKAGLLTGVDGPDIKTAVDWQGPGEPDTLEKIIGQRSSFLPVHFLELGAIKARAVVRIAMHGGSGSGFFTDDNLLITNHHVIATPEQAEAALVQCNFQKTVTLLDAPVDEYRLAPGEAFATSKEYDWTAVRVRGNPNERWGALQGGPGSPR